MTNTTEVKPAAHPAKFSDTVLAAVAPWLEREADGRFSSEKPSQLRVLDCFAGVGRVHELHEEYGDDTWGIELEPEWGSQHPRTVIANSLNPPFRDGTFHVLFTSPCYGNRMADLYDGRDGSVRRTYRIFLGREPSKDSGAGQQWSPAYRELHRNIIAACLPKLVDDGLVIINMSNHLRTLRTGEDQVEIHVTEWWFTMLAALGLRMVAVEPVDTPRFGFGANQQDKASSEFLLVFRKVPPGEEAAARSVLDVQVTQLTLL